MMYRSLALICLALFPLLHLSQVISDSTCHSTGHCDISFLYDRSCDLAVDQHVNFDRREILREGYFESSNSCRIFTVSGLQYIEPGGFEGRQNISTLIIEDSFFDTIDNGTFRCLDKLENLDISSNNKISKLADEAFHNLINLGNLNLSNNIISDIQAEVFKGLGSLTDLDLSYNELQKLGPYSFRHMLSLKYLNLRNNSLTRVSCTAFYNLINLREIDLRDNLIKTIEEPLFIDGQVNVTINLTGNPLRCDCRMAWISSWLDKHGKQLYGQCYAPKDLENRPLSDVYSATNGLPDCPTDKSIITHKEGALLELPCTGVDCKWTTPDKRQLSEHGERQGPYILTSYDALIIDTTDTTNNRNDWFNGIYTFSSEGGSHFGEVDVQIPVPTVPTVSIGQTKKQFKAFIIALSVASSVLVLIPLIYIVTKHDKRFKVDWRSCWKSEENTPLVSKVSFYQSGSENISQNSRYEDEKFKKSPSFENNINKNFDHSGSYNSNAENEYVKAQSFEQSQG